MPAKNPALVPVKKKAFKLASEGHTIAAVARKLKLPYKMVWEWFQRDPQARKARETADARLVSAAQDHMAEVLMDPFPVHETRKDRLALEVLKAAERRPPHDDVEPTKDDIGQLKRAIRKALKDHPDALKAFTENLKAEKAKALDAVAKSDR